MTRTIEIDQFACCSRGDCVEVAPQVSALNADLAIVIGEAPVGLLIRAANSCPSAAVTIIDPATSAQLNP